MDSLPEGSELQGDDDYEYIEPVAEQIFNKKKISNLERGLGRLGKQSRAQHESVMKLELDMKSAVSVQDLHRALGLAFEEVDHRLEETFRDSNTRSLAMFSRRDDLKEMQDLIHNKVNRSDHNAAVKELTELRMYFDSITQSVFMNHIAAMQAEFVKKADAAMVDETLKSKADVTEVLELRARLERLEDAAYRANEEQPNVLQALADKAAADLQMSADEHKALSARASDELATLRDEHRAIASRVEGAESRLESLSEFSVENREVTKHLRHEHETVVMKGIASLKEQLSRVEGSSRNARAALETLSTDTKEFRSSADHSFKQLHAQASSSSKQQEFLTTATEMLKRKSRELSKSNASALKELSDEQENLVQQIAALERFVKRKEREATPRAPHCPQPPGPSPGHSLRAATATPEQGDDLRPCMLEQLEKIISSSPAQPDQALALMDGSRPTLPWYDADGRPCSQGLDATNPRLDLTNLPRFPTPSTRAPSSCDGPSRPGSVAGHARLGVTPRSNSARGTRK